MMSVSAPIFAKEETAARMLDMAVAEFRELVMSGHLPKAQEIAPGVPRWSSDEIRQLNQGAKIDSMDEVDW